MEKQIVNPRSIGPQELRPGMVMIRTVVCHIMPNGKFQVYVCPYPDPIYNVVIDVNGERIPQGMRLFQEIADDVARGTFSVLQSTDLVAG